MKSWRRKPKGVVRPAKDRLPHALGVEFLKNVLEFRAQASRCRQLAVCDTKNSDHWIAEAEKWSRLAQDEISLHYEECNALQASDFPAASRSSP
jgi:hypothetical protein